MKKLAVLALATVLSVSAYAQENNYFERQQPAHGAIPNLQAVKSPAFSSRKDSVTVWQYVGKHTPANLVIEKSSRH